MLRFAVLALFLVSTVFGADHDTFKDCARIPFCTALRNNVVDASSQFAADISGFQDLGNIAYIPLYNAKNDTLGLFIYFIVRNKIRVRILEPDHVRYRLTDVLDGTPELSDFSSVNILNKTLQLTASDIASQYTAIVNKGPPFTIEFYNREELQVVLDAERLLMQNTDSSQAFTFGVGFEGASKLYGLYHHAYKIALDQTGGSLDPFRLRNADVSFYELASPMSLYGSIPVLYGHSPSKTSGIFIHNAAEQWVDINYEGSRPSAYFMVESGEFDIFVLLGPYPSQVVRQYTSLTGTAHMPQIWTLGYHQCRFTYHTQEEIKEVVALMDAHDFPLDVIWLDDGHTNGNRYFEWNPENFTDPVEMLKNISSTGRRAVPILDPHIKVDEDYPVYTGAKGKYFVKWANGSDFLGDCWPGLSGYMDFLNPEASDYYSSWYSFDKFVGSTETIAGIWNDMNEPSVFDNSLEKTLPFETVHYGGVLHRDAHNIYGLMQTKATHKGLIQRDEGKKRPFILTRSHFAGSQRYAAVWTGDNTADWPYLLLSYSECLTANILGQVFCGADIGGFWDIPSNELFQRWYQAAVWLPFFRGHSNGDSPRREPYLFPDDVQSVVRNAIKLRYKHIPVFYTLFYEHTQEGSPVIRPLFYHYPSYLEYDDHLLLGSDILARPVFEPGVSSVTVTFPGENEWWYRADNESWALHSGGTEATVPVDITTSLFYYRGGSIISRLDTERRSTTDMLDDPYTLYVNLDSDGQAYGTLYVDDYTSFAYETDNHYFYVIFIYIPESQGVRIEQLGQNSNGLNIAIRRILVNGRSPFGTGVSSTSYTTTRDGVPLESINIAKLLSQRSGEATIYL